MTLQAPSEKCVPVYCRLLSSITLHECRLTFAYGKESIILPCKIDSLWTIIHQSAHINLSSAPGADAVHELCYSCVIRMSQHIYKRD